MSTGQISKFQKGKGYESIPRELLQDTNLSLEAIGLLSSPIRTALILVEPNSIPSTVLPFMIAFFTAFISRLIKKPPLYFNFV